MGEDVLGRFQRLGFVVVRSVFNQEEVAEMAGAFDRLHRQGLGYRDSYRHRNVAFWQRRDDRLGRILRMVQWPAYLDPVLDRFRRDPRMFQLLEPLLGPNIKQIINQLHWKTPGATHTEFGYHQDIRSRRPRHAFRNPLTSYVQTGIAIDPHQPTNGAMTIALDSHRRGELHSQPGLATMDRQQSSDDLDRLGIDTEKVVDLCLNPGDVALWNLYLVHGSGPNRSDIDRRFYINGYVRAEDCDRGEWVFRDGHPCQLGEPMLVHYEDLYRYPLPQYQEEDQAGDHDRNGPFS